MVRNRRLHDIREATAVIIQAIVWQAIVWPSRRMKAPLCELRVSATEDFSRDRSQLFASRFVFLSSQVLNAAQKLRVVAYEQLALVNPAVADA
jgi:hypothetical protein